MVVCVYLLLYPCPPVHCELQLVVLRLGWVFFLTPAQPQSAAAVLEQHERLTDPQSVIFQASHFPPSLSLSSMSVSLSPSPERPPSTMPGLDLPPPLLSALRRPAGVLETRIKCLEDRTRNLEHALHTSIFALQQLQVQYNDLTKAHIDLLCTLRATIPQMLTCQARAPLKAIHVEKAVKASIAPSSVVPPAS